MNRITKRLGVALVASTLLLVTACSGTTEETPSKVVNTTLTVAMPAVPNSLDPERYEGLISMGVLPNITSTLLRFEKAKPGATTLPREDQLEGFLAESWNLDEEDKSITFNLRKDVKSPYGNSLTSEDVRWSMERMMKSEGSGVGRFLTKKYGWDPEATTTVIDDHTIKVNLLDVNRGTVQVVALYFLGIYDSVEVKKHATADDPFAYKWLGENTATYGAYNLAAVDPGKKIELTANKNYFMGAPEFTNVVVQAIPDSSSRLQLIQNGEVSAATDLTFDQVAALGDNDNVVLEPSVYTNIDMFATFTQVKPFDDKRVRKALSLGLDRKQILESAYKGYGLASDDFFHTAFGEAKPASPLAYDPEKAKKLLAEAGYPDGFEMELAYNVANVGAQSEQAAVLIRSQLAKIGVKVTINAISSGADFDQAKRDGKLQSWLGTSFSMMNVLSSHLLTMYGKGGIANQEQFYSATLDALNEKLIKTQPGDIRDKAIVEVSDLLFDEMPLIPLVDSVKYYALNSSIKGFVSAPVANLTYYDLSNS